jgi:hypothetical protein
VGLWTSNGENNGLEKNYVSFGISWGDAKTNLESLWPPTATNDYDTTPEFYTTGYYYFGYNAVAANRYAYMKNDASIPTGFSKDVDFYIASGTGYAYNPTYSNESAPYLKEDKFGKYPVNINLNSTDSETSYYIVGDNTSSLPSWCDIPTSGTNYTGLGWQVSLPPVLIIRWDVTDGFEYV